MNTTVHTTEIWLGICMLSTICVREYMFLPIIALPNRWTRSISFDWSHSGSCSGNCNACSILLFQVTIDYIYLFMYTTIVVFKYCLSSTVGWLSHLLHLPSTQRLRDSYYSFIHFSNTLAIHLKITNYTHMILDCKYWWLELYDFTS